MGACFEFRGRPTRCTEPEQAKTSGASGERAKKNNQSKPSRRRVSRIDSQAGARLGAGKGWADLGEKQAVLGLAAPHVLKALRELGMESMEMGRGHESLGNVWRLRQVKTLGQTLGERGP